MRVALYIRVSKDEQAQSAETQERAAHGWCAANGHSVAQTYRDIGISGAEWVHRLGILELQRDVARKPRPWDLVLIRDVDRLGRDQVRLPLLLSVLGDHGVQVVEYSTNQKLAMDTTGQLVASIRAFVAQTERELIAHRVRTAHMQQHRDGRVVGGAVYGYRNVRGPTGVHYEIEPSEAEIVREIYRRTIEGEGHRTIAYTLNARTVPPPCAGTRGTGSWSPGAIYEIIRRERYRGVLAWGATAKGYRLGTKTRRPGAEVIRVDAPTLAIVSSETWVAAQRDCSTERQRADRVPKKRVPRHFLIGYATCAACGGPIASTATRHGGENLPAYCCGWRRDRGVCNAAWRRRTSSLDTAVREWLIDKVLDASVLRDAVAEARRRLTAGEPDPQIEALRAEEKEVAVVVSRLVTAVEYGGDVPELMGRIQERRARLDAVRSELSTRTASTANSTDDVAESLDAIVADLRGTLAGDVAGARAITRGNLGRTHESVLGRPQWPTVDRGVRRTGRSISGNCGGWRKPRKW